MEHDASATSKGSAGSTAQPSQAEQPSQAGQGRRGRGPATKRVLAAWSLVVGFAGLVLWLGTPNFSHSHSYGWLIQILRLFDPDVAPQTVIQFHHLVRKSMHGIVYGMLALLAFRASWISFGNLWARVSMTAILVALGVALVDEWRQAQYASRTGSPYDVAIDALGACAAVGLAVLLLRIRLARRRDRAST